MFENKPLSHILQLFGQKNFLKSWKKSVNFEKFVCGNHARLCSTEEALK